MLKQKIDTGSTVIECKCRDYILKADKITGVVYREKAKEGVIHLFYRNTYFLTTKAAAEMNRILREYENIEMRQDDIYEIGNSVTRLFKVMHRTGNLVVNMPDLVDSYPVICARAAFYEKY